MGISRWYKRLRHSHGFGVHSPYAYRFVTEVINPSRGYGYYGYSRIRDRRGRLLLRLLATLNPETVTLCGEDTRRLEWIVGIAAPNARISTSGPSDVSIILGRAELPETAFKSRFFFFSDKTHPAVEKILATSTRGHVYDNGTSVIIAMLDHLPRQVFQIRF